MVNSRFLAEINKLQVSVTLPLFICLFFFYLLPLLYVLGFLFIVCLHTYVGHYFKYFR